MARSSGVTRRPARSPTLAVLGVAAAGLFLGAAIRLTAGCRPSPCGSQYDKADVLDGEYVLGRGNAELPRKKAEFPGTAEKIVIDHEVLTIEYRSDDDTRWRVRYKIDKYRR